MTKKKKKKAKVANLNYSQNDGADFFYTKSLYGRLALEFEGNIIKLPFSKGPWLIGRSRACDVSITGDDHVSRNHCKIEIVRNVPILSDLGSTDGTFLNSSDNPIIQAPLKPGDKILIGNSTVIFLVKEGNLIYCSNKNRGKYTINELEDSNSSDSVGELHVEDNNDANENCVTM